MPIVNGVLINNNSNDNPGNRQQRRGANVNSEPSSLAQCSILFNSMNSTDQITSVVLLVMWLVAFFVRKLTALVVFGVWITILGLIYIYIRKKIQQGTFQPKHVLSIFLNGLVFITSIVYSLSYLLHLIGYPNPFNISGSFTQKMEWYTYILTIVFAILLAIVIESSKYVVMSMFIVREQNLLNETGTIINFTVLLGIFFGLGMSLIAVFWQELQIVSSLVVYGIFIGSLVPLQFCTSFILGNGIVDKFVFSPQTTGSFGVLFLPVVISFFSCFHKIFLRTAFRSFEHQHENLLAAFGIDAVILIGSVVECVLRQRSYKNKQEIIRLQERRRRLSNFAF